MLSRVNKYARVENNEITTIGAAEEKKGNSRKFDNTKRKRKEENNKVGEDGFKGGQHYLYKANPQDNV